MEVADEIVVMNQGHIEQIGTPAEIYDNPASSFVMKFIGEVNILPRNASLFGQNTLDNLGDDIFVRPHELEILLEDDGISSKAIVKRIIHLGWEIQAELSIDNWEITAHLNREKFDRLGLRHNQTVYIKPSRVKSFPTNSEYTSSVAV